MSQSQIKQNQLQSRLTIISYHLIISVVNESYKPPFLPDDSVNAADQDTIGKFKNESEVRKVDLDDASDNRQYGKFSFTAKKAFENECTEFLKFELANGRPLTASVERRKSQACVIS